MNVVFVLITLI